MATEDELKERIRVLQRERDEARDRLAEAERERDQVIEDAYGQGHNEGFRAGIEAAAWSFDDDMTLQQARESILRLTPTDKPAAPSVAEADRLGRYLVFNIGCIECGVGSDIVGFYDDKDKAEKIAGFLDGHLDWREGGQNSFEVFDTRAEQSAEYQEALRALAAREGE